MSQTQTKPEVVAAPTAAKKPEPKAAKKKDDGLSKAAQAVKWARVQETITIPGPSGGTIRLQKGKVVSSQGYNFATLENGGVDLKPCDAPPWWVTLQKGGGSLARQ